MNPKITAVFLALITLSCFAAAIVLYPHAPVLMATHWGANGAVDGHSSRFVALFLLPIILLILDFVWYLLPQIDPIRKGFTGFRHIYDFFWILLSAFFAYVYALSLASNFGALFDFARALLPALGILFIALGVMCPYLKRNWFFGIRTPWTLQSDEIWDATHRFGGRLFIAAGALTFLGGFVSNKPFGFGLAVGGLVAALVISVVYSYLLFRREAR